MEEEEKEDLRATAKEKVDGISIVFFAWCGHVDLHLFTWRQSSILKMKAK